VGCMGSLASEAQAIGGPPSPVGPAPLLLPLPLLALPPLLEDPESAPASSAVVFELAPQLSGPPRDTTSATAPTDHKGNVIGAYRRQGPTGTTKVTA
jgi:hypothetical protein